MYILIADSGSTKTDWVLKDIAGQTVSEFHTQGINPVTMPEQQIREILSTELLPQIKGQKVAKIHFYGAGCRKDNQPSMQRLLSETVPTALEIEVDSDLVGAARSLFGDQPGIACILGTGANSGVYDGKQITENVPPMGYILGDEGSGADIGKAFLNALYKGRLSDELKNAFESNFKMTLPDVINNVYRQPNANRFLASLVPFVKQGVDNREQGADNGELNKMIKARFQAFVANNLMPYQRHDLAVSFVGGVAAAFPEQLREAVEEAGFKFGTIKARPLS